jgi:RNA polymerase sigma-70 factor (ECF subfamily)
MATTTAANTILNGGGVDWKSQVPEQYWELIDRYRSELTTQALGILNNPDDAEDVVQETFCDAFRDPEKLKKADSIGAWLKSINRCNALNRLRDSKRSSKRMEAAAHDNADQTFTTGGFTVMELRESVNKALVVLPANMRTVVKLRYWEYLSCKDIAVRLNMPEGSVKRILFEANNKLYDKLRAQFESKAPTKQFVPAQVREILADK